MCKLLRAMSKKEIKLLLGKKKKKLVLSQSLLDLKTPIKDIQLKQTP